MRYLLIIFVALLASCSGQKEANIDKISGNFRIGSSEAGLTFEGPIKLFNNKETSFIFSVRRSYLLFLFKAFGFS